MRPSRLCMLLPLVLCSCPAAFETPSPPPARHKPIIITGDRDYPPLQFLDRGRPTGLFVAIVRAIERETEIRFDIQLREWSEAQRVVLDGSVDAVGFISQSPEREKQYDFTPELIRLTYSFFTRQEDQRVQADSDLRGLRVGVTQGGRPRQLLADRPGIVLVFVDNYEDGFRELKERRIDLLAADSWVGQYTLQNKGIRGIRTVREPFFYAPAAFAVRKGNRQVLEQLNRGISTIRASGTLDALLDDWTEQEVLYLTRDRVKRLLTMAGLTLAAVLAVGALGIIMALRRQVRRQTRLLLWANDSLEQRIAERTTHLRRSEERFRQLLQTAPVVGVLLRPNGSIVGLNAEAERVLGVRADSVTGESFLALFTGAEDRPHHQLFLETTQKAGRASSFELSVVTARGELRLLVWNGRLLDSGNSEEATIIAMGFDVTDQRLAEENRHRLEEHLRQAEKLQAIGRLAGGIAHDFNNQLTGILGFAELLRRRQTNPADQEYCDRIISAARYSADLTSQLLAFSRRGGHKQEIVDLHDLIRDALAILSRSLPKGVRLETKLAAEHRTLRGEPALIQNCILNLAINARDAMPEGGTLSIRTSMVTLGQREMIRLSVADTGSGIPDSVRRQMFEPFFTTKAKGHGSGMGLALVHSTVQAHGGLIEVESELGRGTDIIILLPMAEAQAPEPIPEFPGATLDGTPHLLLVDDEDIVREATAGLLQSVGATVHVCADGQTGLNALRSQVGRYAAVVLDLEMPGLSGLDTLQRLREFAPALPVLLVSGYAAPGIVDLAASVGYTAFLDKPLTSSKLVHALRSLLDSHSDSAPARCFPDSLDRVEDRP